MSVVQEDDNQDCHHPSTSSAPVVDSTVTKIKHKVSYTCNLHQTTPHHYHYHHYDFPQLLPSDSFHLSCSVVEVGPGRAGSCRADRALLAQNRQDVRNDHLTGAGLLGEAA